MNRAWRITGRYENVDTLNLHMTWSRAEVRAEVLSPQNWREMGNKKQTPVFPGATPHDIEIKHELSQKMRSSS